MTRMLRCYAYRDGQGWEAICVDLDIATFAASLDEVKASLTTCIEMYLERVAELPVDEQPYLPARRSPWHLRVKLSNATLMSWLRGDAGRSRGFTFQSMVAGHSGTVAG